MPKATHRVVVKLQMCMSSTKNIDGMSGGCILDQKLSRFVGVESNVCIDVGSE